MVEQGLMTRTRRAFDRALCALPITQHERIWQIYLVRHSPLKHSSLLLLIRAMLDRKVSLHILITASLGTACI